MNKLYFLFIVSFIQINSQIIENPKFLDNSINPFVLSTNDDYYYVITIGKSLKINKESGKIEDTKKNYAVEEDYIFISDNSFNNYVYYSQKYYKIKYNPSISYNEINKDIPYDQNSKIKGAISKYNSDEIIIYGYYNDKFLVFFTNKDNYSFRYIENINDYKFICKFVVGEEYICGTIKEEILEMNYLIYHHIDPNDPSQNQLAFHQSDDSIKSEDIKSFGLYDVDENGIKLVCKQNNENIKCKFFRINRYTKITYTLLGDDNLVFLPSNKFIDKNCYLSMFNNEYLLCCAITDYIKCYRINKSDYRKIKEFNLSISGDNSYLTIKINSDTATFFFMNNYNDVNSIYEYYIYLPTCQDKSYEILNSLNYNKNPEDYEKLSNLFTIKTNKYYFEIDNSYNYIGYFTLNGNKTEQKTLINNNNYILDFIVTNNIIPNSPIYVNYYVSVEAEEAYTKQCQIKLTFSECYHSCKNCSKKGDDSNEDNHNCITCKDDYYLSPINNNNCYTIEDKKLDWYLDTMEQKFKVCNEKCRSCSGPTENNCTTCSNGLYLDNNACTSNCSQGSFSQRVEINLPKSFEKNTTLTEFKNQIINNITSYVNESKIINGSDFIAVILSSDKIKPEEQLKNGISAFDLGNCTNKIKEYYNISEEENFIIINIELKNKSNNNIDKSFNLDKTTQLELYDYSGNQLNLSVCDEKVKIMKYFGDNLESLEINLAKSLSAQGIDVFNAKDEFFNDICHSYDNPDRKDINLNDRRNEIYQNVTFCQYGCTYDGINYDLYAANCICDSSSLQEDDVPNNINEEKIDNFKLITKLFISNLVSFNYAVLRCYNLAINIKILVHNYGFYCLSTMLVLQFIFFIVYLTKKLKPLKNFMLLFKINNNKNNYKNNYKNNNLNNPMATPPPKINSIQSPFKGNNNNKRLNKGKKFIKNNFNNLINKDNIIMKNHNLNRLKKKRILMPDDNSINSKSIIEQSRNMVNSPYELDSKKYILVSNKFCQNINIKDSIININNNLKDKNNISKNNNNDKIYKIKSKKSQFIKQGKNNIKNIHKIETLQGTINNNIKSKIKMVNKFKLLKNDSDIQDLDYEDAIIYDKRSYLRMCFGFLVDSQIILNTFCTDNNLDLFVIKLSFLVFTFQISFFLNAFFYTDEYISDAYHNNGILDFISGLPKSIYSFVATLIITNLLKMLSSSKYELIRVIRRNVKFQNYTNIINIKLAKLRKKLIIYYILLFLLGAFFLYYVTVFCGVYRYSQKYWFIGCLESFGMDFSVALIICMFLGLFRYISVKKHIKCFYIFANIINTFL